MNIRRYRFLVLLSFGLSAAVVSAQTAQQCDSTAADRAARHNISDRSYSLRVTSGSSIYGTVSCSGLLPEGTSVSLSSGSDDKHVFSRWSDGSSSASTSVVLYSDLDLSPLYNAREFQVSLACDNTMGSVQGGGSYHYLTEATITAVANVGYRFLQWNDGDRNDVRKILVEDNISLEAQFVRVDDKVSNLNIGSDNADEGTVEVRAYAEPRQGYYFYRWSDGANQNPRIIDTDRSATITAQFRYESQQAGRKDAKAARKNKNKNK